MTYKTSDATSTDVFLAIITILMLPFGVAWRGYVLSVMWGWFVTPFGADPIGVAHAIGLSAALAMLTKSGAKSDPDNSFGYILGMMVFYPLLVLGFGAIIHAFM